MIARHPHHSREPPAERAQRPGDIRYPLADVTRDDEPVPSGFGAQALGDLPVLRETDMQVADGEQLRRDASPL